MGKLSIEDIRVVLGFYIPGQTHKSALEAELQTVAAALEQAVQPGALDQVVKDAFVQEESDILLFEHQDQSVVWKQPTPMTTTMDPEFDEDSNLSMPTLAAIFGSIALG